MSCPYKGKSPLKCCKRCIEFSLTNSGCYKVHNGNPCPCMGPEWHSCYQAKSAFLHIKNSRDRHRKGGYMVRKIPNGVCGYEM